MRRSRSAARRRSSRAAGWTMHRPNASGSLDPAAIARVRAEAWPEARDGRRNARCAAGARHSSQRRKSRRAAWLPLMQSSPISAGPPACSRTMLDTRHPLAAASGSPPSACRCCSAIFARGPETPPIERPEEFARQAWTREAALLEIVRSRLGALGPVTLESLAASAALARRATSNPRWRRWRRKASR